MSHAQSTAKLEREKKLRAVLTFASNLSKRIETSDNDATLISELQTQLRSLPLQASSALNAKQEELDKLGTELWNQATRLRRNNDSGIDAQSKDATAHKFRILPFLRAYAFMLLDSAGSQSSEGRQRKSCVRLIKVALKAARVCIEGNELGVATTVLGRAADYEEILRKRDEAGDGKDRELVDGLRAQYFAVRTTLAWRNDRRDTAEYMFKKCKELGTSFNATTTEQLADLLYEIGKASLAKRTYEVAARWLERAYDVLEEQDLDMLSPEIGELRLSIMHSLVKTYMKTKTAETQEKAWQTMKLMETDFGDKMIVSLLKIELLSEAQTLDTNKFYNVLLRMIRTVVLNDANFKTIMHHIHKLKDHSNATACKALDDLMDIRLFREENQAWIEKAVITRIWIGVNNNFADNTLEQLQELFDTVNQNSKIRLSAPATHAAQTLLWKKVGAAINQEQYHVAEAWCRMCLHAIFEKAGAQNKAKVARKIIQCALATHNYEAAREIHRKMPESGRDEPMTRYLMYKAGLRGGDEDFAAECLDHVCRSSVKDATLLYACVMEAQSAGNKRQAIRALEKVLEKYEHSTPAEINLPALLRSTARMLESELIKDGKIDTSVLGQLCNIFEGACLRAKASRTRPSTPAKELFTAVEFEWFSKNAYNISLKYCAEMPSVFLVRLLGCCTELIKLLKEKTQPDADGDLGLRLVFCEFLAACTYTTLARAEDNIEQSIHYYLETCKHSQEFRRVAAEGIDKLSGPSQADIISKHFQVVKLELEAALKLQRWDELDKLFDQCWKYKSPDHYETLADLVLVIHACIVKAGVDKKYRTSKTGSYGKGAELTRFAEVLSVLEKIINLTCRQPNRDVTKLARWLRCLFNISLEHDEQVSLRCIEQVEHMAARQQGELERYPKTELEWLACTLFNRAVDYYLQENDDAARKWASHAFSVAGCIDDGNATRDNLMSRFAKLNFGE